jgi:tripartite-type tricarboxylate transporter receptor subunit TctC
MFKRILSLLALAAVAGAVQAQAWPSSPVRVVVNVAPGGVADRTARLLGVRLGEALGQPMVVENKPGDGGYVGFETVARAAPDGYTVLFSPGSSMMISPHLVKRADFDPVKALTPVVPTASVPMYLVTNPKTPARSLAELIAYGRANPDRLNYGSAGTGSMLHLAGEIFKRETGTGLTHIPYKGAGPALKDLLGGQIDILFDPGIATEHVKAGRLRLLAVSGTERNPSFPDAPTFLESGIRGVDGGPFFGYYLPNGAPQAIVARLNREVTRLIAEPSLRAQLVAQGLELSPPMTPEAFASYVRTESQRYAKLLPELGIRR